MDDDLKQKVTTLLDRLYEASLMAHNASVVDAVERLTSEPVFSEIREAVQQSNSVLRAWVMRLPRRHQGSLLTAIRSCDLSVKPLDPQHTPADRSLVAYLRWLIMVPADAREPGLPGAFMQTKMPVGWKPSQFGHLPQHWLSHVMHALEICGYHHPEFEHADACLQAYRRIVHGLHLAPESKEEMDERLIEDRIAKGTVTS